MREHTSHSSCNDFGPVFTILPPAYLVENIQ